MREELLYRAIAGQGTESEMAAVTAWRRRSAANEGRFQELAHLVAVAREADAAQQVAPRPAMSEITGTVTVPHGRSRPSNGSGGRTRSHWLRWAGLAAAAAAAAAAAVVLIPLGQSAPPPSFGVEDFFAENSQPATIGLRDGTVVRLAPESRLSILDDGAARRVSLAGRAYFAVPSDTAKPFRIETDVATVTVLGTRFDLQTRGDDLRLVVVEGRVELAARNVRTEVGEGHMAELTAGDGVQVVEVPDAASLVDWTGNFVAFQDTPLRDVAREVERHYGVRVHIADPALAGRTVTAWFAGRSFPELAQAICIVANIRCSITGDVLVIHPRE